MMRDSRSTFMTRLKSIAANRSGNFGVMAALTAPVALTLAAFAIDEGALYTERREAQAMVDIAAIAAAANPARAEAAVLATLRDNGFPNVQIHHGALPENSATPQSDAATVTVEPGRYVASPTVSVNRRFESGAQPYNAVNVTLRKFGTRYFGASLIAPPAIVTRATAATKTEAMFSVGSRLAALEGGIVNDLLGALVGGKISLTAMDYNALLGADLELFPFFDALATKLNLTAGTYSDVLDSSISIGKLASAMASIPGMENKAKVALQKIAGAASGQVVVPLKYLVDLGSAGRLALGEKPAGLSVTTKVMQMLMASAVLADGKNQVSVNLGADVLGLAQVKLDIAIGEPPQRSPWLALGETGTVVRTAQTRIRIEAEVGGLGGLLGKLISLPVYADIAYAEARLTDISCASGRPESRRVKIAARPGVVDIRIADINSAAMRDFGRKPSAAPAKLVDVSILGIGLTSIYGQARAAVENIKSTDLTFTHQDINNQTIKKVSTRDVTTSLVQSLIGDLKLEARVLFLTVSVPSWVTSSLASTLGAVTPAIDTVLYNVLTLLGVRIGEADVQVHGATCGRSVLVQ